MTPPRSHESEGCSEVREHTHAAVREQGASRGAEAQGHRRSRAYARSGRTRVDVREQGHRGGGRDAEGRERVDAHEQGRSG